MEGTAQQYHPRNFSEQAWKALDARSHELVMLLLYRQDKQNDKEWQDAVHSALAGVAAFYDDGWRGE